MVKKNELFHHGILGQKWGVRRYQNKDGSLTPAGRERYSKAFFDAEGKNLTDAGRKRIKTIIEETNTINALKKLRDPNTSDEERWRAEETVGYSAYGRLLDQMTSEFPAYKTKEFLDLTAKRKDLFERWDRDDYDSYDEGMDFLESYNKKDVAIYREARSLIEQGANEIIDSMNTKTADLLSTTDGEHKYVTAGGKLTKAGKEWIRENNAFESEKGHLIDTKLSMDLYYSHDEDEDNEILERYKDHKVDESWYDDDYYELYDKLTKTAVKETKRVTSAVADDIGDPNFKEWFSNKYEKQLETDPKYDRLFKNIDKEYRKIANEWYSGKGADVVEGLIGDGDMFLYTLISDFYE